MRKVPSTLRVGAVLSGVVLVYSAAAFAEPVTKEDLAGKTICWSYGGVSTYRKDGSYESNMFGHGTWGLDGDKLIVQTGTPDLPPPATITKQGGILHIDFFDLTLHKRSNASGKVCN